MICSKHIISFYPKSYLSIKYLSQYKIDASYLCNGQSGINL